MTHTCGERFDKYSPTHIRNHPRNEAEVDMQEFEAQQAAKDFLNKYSNEPNFRRLVAQKIAKQEVDTIRPETSYSHDQPATVGSYTYSDELMPSYQNNQNKMDLI